LFKVAKFLYVDLGKKKLESYLGFINAIYL